jgi:hypothetical protein
MENKGINYSLLIIFVLLVFACKEEVQVPTIETIEISSITDNSAISGGRITHEGSSTVLSRGVCWSTSSSPSISDNKTMDGAGAGNFKSSVDELNGGTIYFLRAYATNNDGTGYGMTLSFKTSGQPKVYNSPECVTKPATNIKSISSVLNATVNPNNLPTTVSFEYGTTVNYGNSILFANNPINGNTNNNLSTQINSLIRGTIYHFRVKAVNSKGTSYGQDMVFTANFGFGEFYAGGLIFYLDASKEHGMVAATTDQSAGVKWVEGTFVKTGATGKELGTGFSNTQKIVTIQGAGIYAAKICDDLVLNDYTDWYLPSVSELNLVYNNLRMYNIGNFQNYYYWTSSEDYYGSQASYVKFDLGDISTFPKDALCRVRAIRNF